MSQFTHLPGFTPGRHCTNVRHHIAGELKLLPCPRFTDFPFVCEDCIESIRAGARRSEAAFRGVATRRRQGGPRAPRRPPSASKL